MERNWTLRPHDPQLEAELLSSGQDRLMARLLSQRGITCDQLDDFFAADLPELDNYQPLSGLVESARLLQETRKSGNGVCVLGDYDADGVMATSMVQFICRRLGIPCNVFIPDRFKHGYGLNENSLSAFLKEVEKHKPSLIFTLDCGTSSEDEVAQLRQTGAKIVVIDHHIPNDSKFSRSANVVVNWRLCNSSEMCTAGQVLMLAREIDRTEKTNLFDDLLPLAAIGTVADVSPIIRENRVIVRNGLKNVAGCLSYGIRLMSEKLNISGDSVSQSDVSFRFAPRINSAGRMQQAEIAYRMITETDKGVCCELVDRLEMNNKDRRLLCREITEQAIEKARMLKYKNGLLVIDPSWNIGVVGIVAARVVEEFGIPALIFGSNNGVIKGSGRSLDNANIKAIMDGCSEIFQIYGGHEMAAGATLKPGMEAQAAELFDNACGDYYKKHGRPNPSCVYDADMGLDNIGNGIVEKLGKTLSPYCEQYNPEPIFRLWNVKIVSCKRSAPREDYVKTTYEITKNGRRSPLKVTTFDESCDEKLLGKVVDIFFKFPQVYNSTWEPTLELIDFIVKE